MIPKFLMPKVLRDDYVQIILIDRDNHEKSGLVPLREGGVTVGRTRYRINEKVATRRGIFRVPTYYFIEGNAAPIDPKGELKLGIKPRTRDDDGDLANPDLEYEDLDGNNIDSISNPENMRENVTAWIDGDEEFEKMESHVFRDAMSAFSGGLLDDKRMMMLLLVIAAGFIFLWWDFNQKFEELQVPRTVQQQDRER